MAKEKINIEAFEKCIKETEKKFSYTDGQKEDFVRTLADNCNKNEISVEEARIAIKEKYNFDDEVVTKIITKEYSNKKSIEDFLNEKYEFRYNEIVDKIEFRASGSGPYIFVNDYLINSIHRALTKAGYKITSGNLYNLLTSDFVPKYNPFKDYFDNLPEWDEKDYILEFSELVQTDDTDFWKDALTRWLIALIACSLNNGVTNHSVIVLYGGQGIGKSRFISKILPPELSEYKYSGTINPNNRDSLILLSENILIDLDELGSLNRKDEKAMKELITKGDVQLRRPYGRVIESMPRRASFIGSVNDGEFLMDMTGNRRFLCFEVSNINYNSEINYKGLYSQIMHLYRAGNKFWFDSDEIKIIDERNEKFRAKNPIEELILAEYQPCSKDDSDCLLSSTDILRYLKDKYSITMDSTSSMIIGKIMTKYEFQKTKSRGTYRYAVKKQGI
jgi:hypothetical protein